MRTWYVEELAIFFMLSLQTSHNQLMRKCVPSSHEINGQNNLSGLTLAT